MFNQAPRFIPCQPGGHHEHNHITMLSPLSDNRLCGKVVEVTSHAPLGVVGIGVQLIRLSTQLATTPFRLVWGLIV